MGVAAAPAQAGLLKIGVVAARSGISVKTIRFYCDQGLLQPVSRSEGRYRLFDDGVFAELSLIRRLRSMEIPLETIGTVLDARRSGICTSADLQATIRSKLLDIHARIADLQALESDLSTMLATWESCGGRSNLTPDP
jgi:DNA-binding transcriptional MerR regulator